MLLASVVLTIFVYGVVSSMLGSLLPALGFTGEQNGTLALTQAAGLGLASLSAGPVIDIHGKKVAMLAGLAAISAALWLLPNATGNFPMAAVLWFIQGLGGGVTVTASNSLVSDLGGVRRSSVLNSTNLFFGLGLMVTPFLASSLFAGDVRGLCHFAAALSTGTLVVQAAMRMPLATGGKTFNLAAAGQLLHSPALRLFAAFAFLYVACEVGVSNWLAKYMIAAGLPAAHAFKIMSLGFALGLLLGRVIVSRVLLRVPATNVVIGCSMLMMLTTFGMLHTGASATSTAVAVFCVGLSMAGAYPTTLGMVGDAFPTATGSAMGLVITAGWAGLAVSSRLIGAIAGSDEGNLPAALLVFPIFSALMIGVSLAMRRLSRNRMF